VVQRTAQRKFDEDQRLKVAADYAQNTMSSSISLKTNIDYKTAAMEWLAVSNKQWQPTKRITFGVDRHCAFGKILFV
jgi:hypothetical protein